MIWSVLTKEWNIMKCSEIIEQIRVLCPEKYAQDWDNVGLLVGDENRNVNRLLIALDATDSAVDYAVYAGAEMLITHHPMIFSSMKKVVYNDFTGRRIISLIENGISYYAMHTNFDVCCMADEAAGMIGMDEGEPLEVTAEINGYPAGIGKIAFMSERTIKEWSDLVKHIFNLDFVVVYGDENRKVKRIAISPGSGKSMIREAVSKGAELIITGDIGHHEGIDAVLQGLSVIDAGHYGLEHIYIDYMKNYLEKVCHGVEIITFKEGCPGKLM